MTVYEPYPDASTLEDRYRQKLIESAPHLSYAFDVADGAFPACELVIAACNRAVYEHLNPNEFVECWEYRREYADVFLKFASRIPHVRGDFARGKKTFVLPDWQRFYFCEAYGWRDGDYPRRRRFTDWILEVGKKNGKTSIMSIVGLYETKHGDEGGEVYSVATKEDQAKKCWADARKMYEKMPIDMAHGMTVTTKQITTDRGYFQYLSSKSDTIDGPDPSVIFVDEAAAIKDSELVNKLVMSTASRMSPIIFKGTHPQYDTMTAYYQDRTQLVLLLTGGLDRGDGEREFGLIYCVDDEEEIKDEKMWIKANPNLGVSVRVDYLRKLMRKAQHQPMLMSSLKTYHFGLWLTSATGWLELIKWTGCAGEVVREGYCTIGVDLALVQDLCAVCRIWVHEKTHHWHIDWKFWTTQTYLDTLPPDLLKYHLAAAETGILEIQLTEVIDFDEIDDYILQTADQWKVSHIGIDPWNARALSAKWLEDGYPVFKVHQSPGNLNDPRQETESRIKKRRLVHENNPYLAWQLNNCAARKRGDVLTIQQPDGKPDLKIDGFAALWTAARCMSEAYEVESDPKMRFVKINK